MRIAKDCLVGLEMKVSTPNGEVLEHVGAGGETFFYIHGHDVLLHALEEALAGHEPGDRLDVTLAPEQAYGAHDPSLMERAPLDALPPELRPEIGATFVAERQDGKTYMVLVREVSERDALLDANHPLAGMPLRFETTVKQVRRAKKDELAEFGFAPEA